eukprot:scaffold63219_cov33-Tisochrysis_lutea.AAC.11
MSALVSWIGPTPTALLERQQVRVRCRSPKLSCGALVMWACKWAIRSRRSLPRSRTARKALRRSFSWRSQAISEDVVLSVNCFRERSSGLPHRMRLPAPRTPRNGRSSRSSRISSRA